MGEANRLIKRRTEADSRLVYVDVHTPMIGADGLPGRDLLVDDCLHCRPPGTPSGLASRFLTGRDEAIPPVYDVPLRSLLIGS